MIEKNKGKGGEAYWHGRKIFIFLPVLLLSFSVCGANSPSCSAFLGIGSANSLYAPKPAILYLTASVDLNQPEKLKMTNKQETALLSEVH